MPDYLAQDIPPPDSTKHTAINTLGVVADDIQAAIRAYVLDAFDQQTISRLVEGNHVSRGRRNQEEGDFANQHKIPFSEFRSETVPPNFQEPEH